MIRLMLWVALFAAFLLLGGILAQLMIADAGVVLISWQSWMVETTLWGAAVIVLSVLCLVVALIIVWRKFGPTQLLNRYRNRRDRKVAKKETAIAIESWLKGDEERALKALQRVIQAGGSDRLPAAVSLAIGMQQSDWDDRYRLFITQDAELKLFADTLQAERLWQNKKTDDFIELLLSRFELRQIPWLRERYWQALFEQNRALELLNSVNEAANIQPDLRQHWLVKAAQMGLVQAQTNLEAGSKILKNLSKAQRNLPAIVKAEIAYLLSIGADQSAFKRAKFLLNSRANVEMADVLLDIQVSNIEKINLLESLQPATPGVVFCRTMGVINLRQQLWGNAQSLLEQGWQLGDRTCGLHLAELFEQRKMADQAAKLYRELARMPSH